MSEFAKRGREVAPPPPPPLPDNIEDWVRQIKAERTLNDLVEDIHRALWNESEEYRKLLHATVDPQAVEGSLSMDNALAVQLIRKKAKDIGSTEVASEKLAVINLALGVVLRRYKASRKQRRNMVGGQQVPDDNGGE
jgi:malonyl CoA-acyl carrier protein transacylase